MNAASESSSYCCCSKPIYLGFVNHIYDHLIRDLAQDSFWNPWTTNVSSQLFQIISGENLSFCQCHWTLKHWSEFVHLGENTFVDSSTLIFVGNVSLRTQGTHPFHLSQIRTSANIKSRRKVFFIGKTTYQKVRNKSFLKIRIIYESLKNVAIILPIKIMLTFILWSSFFTATSFKKSSFVNLSFNHCKSWKLTLPYST